MVLRGCGFTWISKLLQHVLNLVVENQRIFVKTGGYKVELFHCDAGNSILLEVENRCTIITLIDIE